MSSRQFRRKSKLMNKLNKEAFVWAKEILDSETDVLLTDKLERTKEVNRYKDIVMLWKKEMAFAVLGCENQTKVHHAIYRNKFITKLGV